MEFVALLRVLWRHRVIVAAGFVVALGIGYLATRGPTVRSGVASAKVLVDTQASEILVANAPGAPTLGWRTDLLTTVMATDPVRERIATAMHAQPDDVVVSIPAQATPAVPMEIPVGALEGAAGAAASKPFQADFLASSVVPIIRIDTRAPSAAQAARLATVAADVMTGVARARGTTTPGFPVLSPQDLVVRNVGPVKSRTIVNGPRHTKAAMLAVVVFLLWCSVALALAGAIGRARRRPRRVEASPAA